MIEIIEKKGKKSKNKDNNKNMDDNNMQKGKSTKKQSK